jgi:hypothetical protein
LVLAAQVKPPQVLVVLAVHLALAHYFLLMAVAAAKEAQQITPAAVVVAAV